MQEEYQLVVDLGALGTCVMEDIDPIEVKEGFTVIMDGFTENGIRVHMVKDSREHVHYPYVWQNAVLFKMEE